MIDKSIGCASAYELALVATMLTLAYRLPGVPPTNLKAEVPFTAVVNIRGDRLYHEHISWDQGTVLRQLGLMPEYLPFPRHLSGSEKGSFEYKVPVAGRETAEKMRDRNGVQSNEMFGFEGRHKAVDAPAGPTREM